MLVIFDRVVLTSLKRYYGVVELFAGEQEAWLTAGWHQKHLSKRTSGGRTTEAIPLSRQVRNA